jgi:hypothetical protein
VSSYANELIESCLVFLEVLTLGNTEFQFSERYPSVKISDTGSSASSGLIARK